MTPRLRVAILAAATLIWAANTMLPLFTRYQPESGIGVGVLGVYGVVLGLPELAKRRGSHGKDDDEGGEKP